MSDPEQRLRIVDPSTPAQVAENIAAWLEEAIELARKAGLTRTAYLLEMAQFEVRQEGQEKRPFRSR